MSPADVGASPLVAIVTPVYNGARFLAETMASVQAQTYPNLVHILLDNASTDATPDIIESFKGGRVPLIVARNPALLPILDNWNAAIGFIPAQTAYFRILCADDAIMPEATERMVALAESDPRISVVSSAVTYNDTTYDFGWCKDRNVFESDDAIRRYFTNEGPIEARQALMRREALASASPFFDYNVGLSPDIDAVLRMLQHGRFGYLHEPLIRVREHNESASRSIVAPLRTHYHDWLVMMRRYARPAFGAEYEALERRYVRFYLRRMLRWRSLDRAPRVFELHMDLLQKIGDRPNWIDFGDAIIDFVLEKLALRPGWYSYPR